MLLASVAFGVHKVLLAIGSEVAAACLVTAVGLLWLALRLTKDTARPILSDVLLILRLFRFAVPAMVITSDLLFDHFLADTYRGGQQALDDSSNEPPEVEGESTELSDHLAQSKQVNSLSSFLDGLALPSMTMPQSPVETIKQKAAESVSHIIDVIVVFILHVLVIPVLTLCMFYRSMHKLVEAGNFSSPGTRRS